MTQAEGFGLRRFSPLSLTASRRRGAAAKTAAVQRLRPPGESGTHWQFWRGGASPHFLHETEPTLRVTLDPRTLLIAERRATLALNRWVLAHPMLSLSTKVVAQAGSWTAAGILTALLAYAHSARKPQLRDASERTFLNVALTYLAVALIGRAVPRGRPFALPDPATGLVAHSPSRSFPSRHVASAVAMAATIRSASPTAASVFGTIAVALGISRVAAGVHFPSDVLGGAVLGLCIGRLTRSHRITAESFRTGPNDEDASSGSVAADPAPQLQSELWIQPTAK